MKLLFKYRLELTLGLLYFFIFLVFYFQLN
jgi:hypothetical protein